MMFQTDMSNYLLGAISYLCFLQTGVHAEECSKAVLVGRETFYVPAGGSLSLSCVVQHCGDQAWTGNWTRLNLPSRFVKASVKHRMTRLTLSANETQMTLTLLRVNQSDEGSYGCRVEWSHGDIDQGHWLEVNVTAAVPSSRTLLHRFLVCAGASLCIPIILGLARCLSSEVKPQPLPRVLSTHAAVYRDKPHPAPQPLPRCPVPQKCSTSSHKTSPKSQQKTEVVYADISQGALRQQGATREPAQSTVYSSLRFPRGGPGKFSSEDQFCVSVDS